MNHDPQAQDAEHAERKREYGQYRVGRRRSTTEESSATTAAASKIKRTSARWPGHTLTTRVAGRAVGTGAVETSGLTQHAVVCTTDREDWTFREVAVVLHECLSDAAALGTVDRRIAPGTAQAAESHVAAGGGATRGSETWPATIGLAHSGNSLRRCGGPSDLGGCSPACGPTDRNVPASSECKIGKSPKPATVASRPIVLGELGQPRDSWSRK